MTESFRLFSDYIPPENGWCETFEAPGLPRPHWKTFLDGVGSMEAGEFEKRILESKKILARHGATYNVTGDPEDLDRPWELDLIPMLISFQEWRRLEAGLIQRARLLNAIVKDIYSEQKLFSDGLLPKELIFANPGFLHPCMGVKPPDDAYLTFFAVDVLRNASGEP